MLSQVLGWTATILFSLMIIPQMYKTIKLRDTTGVSLFLFIIYFIGNVIALIYSILIEQPPLFIKYIIALITTIVYIIIYIYFKNKRRNKK